MDAVEPQIRALLAEFPDMPATVIDGTGRLDAGQDGVLRPGAPVAAVVPAGRSGLSAPHYQPGELAQCDLWFPPVDVPLGFGQVGRPPVLVMVAGYSRVLTAVMIPSRQSPDLLAGHWSLMSGWGATPKALVWDNESAVGQWRGGRPQLTEAMNAFRGSLGIKVIQCRPGDPEAKGLVERANGYLETSFLPGRSFASPADFNTQLDQWLARANARHHRLLGCRPVDRWDADRAAMLALPPVAPVVGWRLTTRLPRDHYVRLDGNDYSVHPTVIGRRVEVHADAEQVEVSSAGTGSWPGMRAAGHATRPSPTRPTAAAAAKLRAAVHAAAKPAAPGGEVQHRALSDYDRMFGLDEQAA